jgi:NAD-dependent SIR2 family protein deacetylase
VATDGTAFRIRPTLSWTPSGQSAPTTTSVDELATAIADGGVVVLSGAGLSTESGVPDYRGVNGRLRRHMPMTYDEFVRRADSRQRYWARSHLGWRTIARAQPNRGHLAVTALRTAGVVSGVITQNVDGLHQAAGTTDVIELHGNLDRVICLGCRQISPRIELHERLGAANPGFAATATRVNPDGDVDLDESAARGFQVVSCASCGDGVLKPDVVFFGENVPAERVGRSAELVDAARSVLVLGSSLAVMSGLRFVKQAARAGTPVFIINRGETRGDQHAEWRVDRSLGDALTELAARLVR